MVGGEVAVVFEVRREHVGSHGEVGLVVGDGHGSRVGSDGSGGSVGSGDGRSGDDVSDGFGDGDGGNDTYGKRFQHNAGEGKMGRRRRLPLYIIGDNGVTAAGGV